MTDTTAEFFDELGRRDHEPLLEKVSATVRFDLVNGTKTDRWLVAVDKGDVTVAHKGGPADVTMRTDKALFDGLAGGEVNAVAAVLRGAIVLEGDWELMVLFQRLFPGPPAASKPQAAVGSRRKR